MSLPVALVLAVAAPASNGVTDFLSNPIFFLVAMFAAMYFLLFRPQQQRQKQHQQMISAIKRGDTVVLSSGVIGKVVRVEDSELGIEIAQNVNVKVVKSMVTEVRAKGEPAPANDAKAAKAKA